ncbi:hypothetical protein [Streptomyces griseoruber]|uniref:hypothetical protein n=1 Tax=Streptomyces griseoruber TaxID=1943 RepID=UPI0007C75508|nr:hypothetical protein [Streptomyces griseoruber]
MPQRTVEQTRQDIRELVIAMAPDQSFAGQADPELVDGLGYHSLALLELAFALEDEYDLPPIDREHAQRIRRISDVVDYVLTELGNRVADGGTR